MERETTCCFTGHRPEKLPWGTDEGNPLCLDLKRRLAAAVLSAYDRGMRHFICGMARGCDLYFCEAVLALREMRPGVTVEAAIPCESQADRWPEGEKQRYRRLLERAPAVRDTVYWPLVRDYADDSYDEICRRWIEFGNRVCEGLSEARLARCMEIFRECSRLELGFWEMSRTPREDLPPHK